MRPRSLFSAGGPVPGTAAIARTTALDFTIDDRDGVPHHVFSDLGTGNAVVLDFVMMNSPTL